MQFVIAGDCGFPKDCPKLLQVDSEMIHSGRVVFARIIALTVVQIV